MKSIDNLAVILLIVGGFNWGIASLFEFNLVDYIFGEIWIDRVLYFLIGVSALFVCINWKRIFAKTKHKS